MSDSVLSFISIHRDIIVKIKSNMPLFLEGVGQIYIYKEERFHSEVQMYYKNSG
jgi:hypothetical protein